MKRGKFSIGWLVVLMSLGLLLNPQNKAFAGPIVTGTTVGVKWYPGHYYHLMTGGGDPSVNSYSAKAAYQEMNVANSGIVGLQLRLSWRQLEPTRDNYNPGFAIIDGHINKLKLTKKRFFLFIAYKADRLDVLPDYIKSSGGAYRFSFGGSSKVGEGAKFWDNSVRDRFNQLVRRLGERYNENFTFMGVALPETALSKIQGGYSGAQENAYYSNLLVINERLRDSFPNTITTQFTNFPREILQNFVMKLRDMGAALGGPDVWLDDPGVNMINQPNTPDGVYSYYPKLSGVVALTPSVMSGNYDSTTHDPNDPKSRKPSIMELLGFAKVKLKANIIFWTRDTTGPTYHYKKVLSTLKNLTQANDSSVKLDINCPSKYINCLKE